MSGSTAPTARDRFLIALAKLLGEESRPEGPPLGVLTEDWHFGECLTRILGPIGSQFSLSPAHLNELLVHCGRGLVSNAFYQYFFGDARTIDDFERGVDRFRTAAMLLYGNFRHALDDLGHASPPQFTATLRTIQPINAAVLSERAPFEDIAGIQAIAKEDLFLLGYITKECILLLDICLRAVDEAILDPAKGEAMWRAMGDDRQKKVVDALTAEHLTWPALASGKDSLEKFRPELQAAIDSLRTRREEACKIGIQNTRRYLTLPDLDVYFATSMREEGHYIEQQDFIAAVFACPEVSDLRLRYFDPTLSWVDDRITKGLIECLMLRRAQVTVYHAGDSDSLGKDSELAATLAQGKPVIVYVPQGSPKFDKRAENFRVEHPLGLQIDVRTGVAHGILVVRTPEHCAKLLRGVLLRELQYEIRHEGGNYQLVEQSTRSVVRVVSDDPLLTHAFWTFFHRPTDPN